METAHRALGRFFDEFPLRGGELGNPWAKSHHAQQDHPHTVPRRLARQPGLRMERRITHRATAPAVAELPPPPIVHRDIKPANMAVSRRREHRPLRSRPGFR